MKQIVFFVEMKVTIRDEIRLGLNYFSKKGLKIKILNVAPITRAKYFKNYSPVGQIKSHKEEILLNKKKIIDAISKLDKNAFVFFLLGRYNKVKFIIAEIEKRNIKYGYIFNDRLPVKPKSNLEIIELSLRFPFSAAKQVIYKINTKIGFGKKPHFIFCSGKNSPNFGLYNQLHPLLIFFYDVLALTTL